METKDLIEKIKLDKHSLYFDGTKVFDMPNMPDSTGRINVFGITEISDDSRFDAKAFIGSGSCCYGYAAILGVDFDKEIPKLYITDIATLDLNVFDILPIALKHTYSDNEEGYKTGILATGTGCDGSGVRYISSFNETFDVLNTEETWDKSISLGIFRPNFDQRLELTDESRILYTGWGMVDITERLMEKGLDLEKTVERNEVYLRTHIKPK